MTAVADSILPLPSLVESRPAHNPWLIAIVVSMATFMEVLDTSIANVSLHHIAGNLGAGNSEATWVLTSYLVSNAIVLPLSGWLSNVMGRKRFYMTCVAIFTVSSLLCGMAPSLGWLLVFRVIQGAGGGGLAPSEQSILADTFPARQRGMAFAVYGLAVVFAPAIGPTLGGWITDNFNWRWIFYINVPVGILSIFLTYRMVYDSPAAKAQTAETWKHGLRIDYMGFALVALGLGCLQVVLDKGQEDDWFSSRFIQIFGTLCVVGIVGAIIWEVWIADDPVVDLTLLKRSRFAFTNLLMFIVGFILNSTTVLIPQFAQQSLGYNATQAGLLLMGGGFALMVMMPVSGFLTSHVQPKYLMAYGIAVTSLAMWHMSRFNLQVTFSQLVMARIYQAIALPFFFIPINTVAYSDLPPGKSNQASALINLMRNLGGSTGIAIAVLLLERRTQLHHARLIEHLSPYDSAFMHTYHLMINMFSGGTGGGGAASLISPATRALSVIDNMVNAQATMLAYLDVFKIMAIGCAPVIVLCLMLKKMKSHHAEMGH
jgi:DHA2 family multidrug resistance protein